MGNCSSSDKTQTAEEVKRIEAMTADEKLEHLWALVTKDTSAHGYSGTTLHQVELLMSDLNRTFDHHGDEMYGSTTNKSVEDDKDLHLSGAVAALEWVSYNNHDYTGAYRGTKNMLVRVSQAGPPDFGENAAYSPGFAFKALRTGAPSGTLLAMHAFQVHNFNTFAQDYSNHISDINMDSDEIAMLLKVLVKKFQSVPTVSAFRMGGRDWAEYEEDGTKNEKPRYPFRVQLHPPTAMRELFSSEPPESKDINWQPIQLGTIPEGTTLFQVFVEALPDGTGLSPEPIGEIVLRRRFTTSHYGDRSLFFKHPKFDEDVELHPEWEEPALQEHAEQRKLNTQFTYPMAPDYEGIPAAKEIPAAEEKPAAEEAPSKEEAPAQEEAPAKEQPAEVRRDSGEAPATP